MHLVFFHYEIYLLIKLRIYRMMSFMIIIQTSGVLKHPETYQAF